MNYPYKVKQFDPEVTDDVTGQVKVRIFDFSGLVTSASKISMLSANKANNTGQGHVRSPGEKGQTKKFVI